ncbi:MAG: hypothetical protein IPK17_38980 [Chloroflexi bacterium]|uniref:hypothetical protein n=1 Tax=Candidatus Flexifilum breve TaxID=3140694 RepID=UPI0031357DEA|nr:hypothetical protein [Chloroflexota bacterium]
MIAAVRTPEVLQLQEVAKPVPQAKQILVKVPRDDRHRRGLRVRSFTVPRLVLAARPAHARPTKPRRPSSAW